MRKNCARKWLHLVIDLFPVLILPIFAIWEINHKENENITVEVENHQVLNFNQLINTSTARPNTWADTLSVDVQDDGGIAVNGYLSTSYRPLYYLQDNINFVVGHKYYVRSLPYSSTLDCCYLQVRYLNGTSYINRINELFTLTGPVSTVAFQYGVANSVLDDVYYLNLFDLTQMYGEGNEPSISDFNIIFPNNYYAYTLSKKTLITNGTIVYDNTDIGSQMLYAVYKPVQQYFNFDNIFNFGALRNWFELNFFNGNMGIPMTIIWNIIIYEFLSDVIMLIYAFFMFIIDFANDLLEKPFSDIKRG